MEIDGEAGGGGEEGSGRGELGRLLEAIKSSEVLENRIPLINQLEGSSQFSADDLGLILESLVVSWDDSTCSGVSHCMLHKSILQVALKCSDLDTIGSLGPFLTLGAKASSWCGKHLGWFVESIDDSEVVQEEEHSSLCLEIISLILKISIKLLPVAAKCIGVDVVHTVGDFISQLLTLTESSIVDKTIHGAAAHVAKAAPVFLDETIKLCRAYCEAAKSETCRMSMLAEETTVKHKVPDLTTDVIRITTCTIQTMCKVGTYAASSGGSQVALLTVSWKGVVSLLQFGKGLIEVQVSVGDIISTLISLVIESLRVAAETWCMSLHEVLGISEARRSFLPIKFFLINAVRICSVYPSEALTIYKDLIRCVLVISSTSILFSKDPLLKAANEALVELLEPNSFLLLDTLMKSSEVRTELKCQLVQCFLENGEANSLAQIGQDDQRERNLAQLGCIFSVDPDVDGRNRALLLAEVIVFLHFLNVSSCLTEEVVIELSKKLGVLLDILTLEDVYSYVLGCQIPTLYVADHPPVVVWQPVYTCLIQALKTLMIVAASSSVAWNELQTFLLESLFHPHFLCMETVTELWCFFVRSAENETSTYLINQLFLLLKTVASTEKVLAPLSALRKVACAFCIILSYASCATVDHIYASVLNDNSSKSSILHLALLMEGFPFDSLSDGIKAQAVKKLFTSFAGYLQSYLMNHGAIDLATSGSGVIGLPVHALASALQRCEINDSNTIDGKSITTMFKFSSSLIHLYRTAPDSSKNHLALHISSILDIISNMRHLCAFYQMEKLTVELQTFFMSSSDNSKAVLSQCKPSIASFMAVLGHLSCTGDNSNALCSAMSDLYHLLLRERHWALIHLVMDSFGYFAARTSFTQLWRFIPGDAALSYNTSTGVDIDENGFMLQLRAFLQKEGVRTNKWSEVQISLLISEGRVLKKLIETFLEIPIALEPEKAMIEKDANTKKRKMPDGICEGMALLQNGIKVMRSALGGTDSAELRDRFAAHLSRLEDTVSQISSFSEQT
ncbi:uncharacterized protein LOC100843843 isoform X2 [Brachypodium distachyon]|uniref:Uncharacterized protein n=1 Tax=Brachypodium distachyon TaxID=15368 RepID=A0A0Q3HL77_BRADI|nr:uncharacterized protein LOC100843843 isoform X2 [Brachypodium distachyon]KQK23695.1 hypothetical protein BRADI_1g75460v3 [Brachypodium distachyon]|eukprot:XP_014757484.1 uncharacterized protein LOC100843843 isoform X2 [Brachypodium distachyon]